jgi:hypothetical protein
MCFPGAESQGKLLVGEISVPFCEKQIHPSR